MIELAVVLVIVLLILSPGKLAKVSKALGRVLSPLSKNRKRGKEANSEPASTGRNDGEYGSQGN